MRDIAATLRIPGMKQRFRALQRRRRPFLAALATVLSLLAAAPAAAEVLVSNIGQTESLTSVISGDGREVAFTTGAVADGFDGFTLESVEIAFRVAPSNDLTVKIVSGSLLSGTEVATLANPSSLGQDSTLTFTAPAKTTLSANTTYAVVAAASTGTVSITQSDAEDSGGRSGWTIADSTRSKSSTHVMRVRVNGADADLTAPSFSSATVEGTALKIKFDENLAQQGFMLNLANSAFTVKKTPQGGMEANASLTGSPSRDSFQHNTLNLTLATAAVWDDTFTVAYTKPSTGTGNRLRDAVGNETDSFGAQRVTNITLRPAPTACGTVSGPLRPSATSTSTSITVSPNSSADMHGGQIHLCGPFGTGGAYATAKIFDELIRTGESRTITHSGAGNTGDPLTANTDYWIAVGSYGFNSPWTHVRTPFPTVTIAAGTSPVTEGTAATFTVTADAAPTADLTVSLTVADSDFVSTAHEGSKTVTISSGSTTATHSVATAADATAAGSGDVMVTVAAGTGYTVGSPASASVTVNRAIPSACGTASGALTPSVTSTSTSITFSPNVSGQTFGSEIVLCGPFGTGGAYATAQIFDPATINPGDSFTITHIAAGNTGDPLTAGTDYWVRVTGYDRTSAWVYIRTKPASVPTDTAPDFGSATVANQGYTQNSAITDLVLPAATGGNGDLTYALTPALPAGLTFTASTRTISGTPTATQATTTYTYKVTDADANTADSDADTLSFTITVAADAVPDFGSATVANQGYTQNTAITDLVLPAATGGNGTLTYALTPALPAGLTFTASTRTISGTPTATQAATTYTYRVSDADGNTADSDADTLSFTITVAADAVPDFGSATVANQSYTQNSAITDLVLPSATGGNGTLTYALTPALPAGLTFTASTRTISGTPTATQAATTYTYRVSDADGNTADADADTLTFTIAVAADAAPDFGTATVANQSYTQNSAITDLVLPAATGGNGALTYAITPALPAGLTFTVSTRTISGTPTATQAATTYTYKVTDADGNTADSDADTLTFTIAVAADTVPDFGSGTVPNQGYTQNSAITDLVLPSATGGNGALTYTITSALPAGLTFTASTRTISGTPTAAQAATTYTYRVTDADGNMADSDADTLTFTITVTADTVPDFGTATVANQGYTQNIAITDLVLPSATGGNGTLSYALTPALPTGLTFTASTRTISGTPTATQAATTYTYRVTDADGNTAASDADTLSFTIAVATDTAPDFGSATVPNQGYTQNSAITDLELPAATGGNGALSYALTPALPAGLTFTASSRKISGTPTAAQAATTYTYKVTDADGNTADSDADTLSFTIAVAAADTAPDFGSATVANQSYTQNSAITDLVLPSATGGNGTLTYALTPALPAGLTFTASTRTISGTPTATQAATTYTYKVTDADANTADSDADTLSFTITVAAGDTAPSFGGATVANQGYTQNTAITDLTLPSATGGNGVLTYAITPALPAGLSFTASSRKISGTPTAAQAATTYTYKVTDADANTADSDADTLSFTITVATDTAPDFGSATVPNQGYTQNSAITDLVLPSATGGNGALTYALTPALPAGLTFTASTRTISGTPTATQAATTYTYRVSDADGNTADSDADTLSFTIAVAGDAVPDFGSATVPNQGYTRNSAITDLVLPSATGGNGALSYALTPAPPAGLSFTASTRTISGTPTATQAATTYTYRVSDADGNTADSDTDTLSFTITVAADTAPDFGSATVPNQGYTQNTAITSLTLPSATGGNGDLSYAITPALPAGLSFTASTRTISGTPTATQAATTYTYKVTDADANTADSDADTLSFTITVAAADTAPDFGSATVPNKSYTQNAAITDLTLPAATGGNGALSYALTPALPAGLTFTASTRTISGTPTATQAATTYTYKVSDADGNTADSDADTLSFTITVAAGDTAPDFGGATVPNQGYTRSTAITDLVLPSATGGNGALTYALTPALPAGLTFTASTRTISGTPTAAQATTTYTYRVTDADANTADSDADTLSFTITVAADTAPDFGSATVPNQGYTQNAAITGLTLPSATGGNGALTYAITPALPAGLTFTASTRTISGTPTATQAATTYTYKVTDADGNTADSDADTLSFTIAVAEADTPPVFTGGVQTLRLEPGEAMTPVVLPTATGGNGGPYSYALTSDPAGLAGLSFVPATRTLSGTPDAERGSWTFNWTAHDGDANRQPSDAARLTFRVTVGAAPEVQRRAVNRTLAAVATGTVASALDTIGTRFGDVASGASLTLAGESMPLDAPGAAPATVSATETRPWAEPVPLARGVDADALLSASSFSLPLGAAEGEPGFDPDAPRWSVWGRGDFGQFAGRPEPGMHYGGRTRTGWLGVDARGPKGSGRWLAGLAVSRGTGKSGYSFDGGDEPAERGRLETVLNALWPYGGWTLENGLALRGILGAGTGSLRHMPGDGGPAEQSGLTMWAISVGLRGELAPQAGFDMAARGDASFVRMETGKGEQGIDGLRADTWRLRAGVEAARRYEIADGRSLTPFLELAVRQDGGDGLTGTGLEVAGGLRHNGPGIDIELRARWLAAHTQEGTEEHGVSLTVRMPPKDRDRGLSMSLSTRRGAGTGGAEALWREELPKAAPGADAHPTGRLEGEVGYGFPALGGRFTATPNAGFSREDGGGRDYRIGWRLAPAVWGDPGFRVSLDATRRESVGSERPPRHGMVLRTTVRW